MKMGKRYRCETCGIELMCVRNGEQPVTCHGAPLVEMATRKLPSSD